MPRDTDDNALGKVIEPLLEAIDRLLEVQEKHDEILVHLEQREIPDIQGLTRRLEEVGDAIERLKPHDMSSQERGGRAIRVASSILLIVVLGYFLCWLTVRWLPSTLLPPGFSRTAPVQQKGRF